MLFNSPCKDQDVVQVHHYYSFSDEVPKDAIHYYLEGGQTVCHPKEHYQGLKQAVVDIEDSLLLVSGLDAYVVETLANVQFSEILGSVELQYEFRDKGQGILVLYYHGVESPIVLY